MIQVTTKYVLVRDGKVEHLLNIMGATSRCVASSSQRQELLSALIIDAGLVLHEIDVPLARAIPAPAAVVPGTKTRSISRHGAKRSKTKRLGPVARMKQFKKNPKCPSCNHPMHIAGHHRSVTYYKCKRGCPKPLRDEGYSSANLGGGADLEKEIRARVAAANGHDPQLRDDVVQEIITDIAARKLKLNEVDTATIRRYTRSQSRLGQQRRRDISLDVPIGNQPSL